MSQQPDKLPVVSKPSCRYLRSKGMFVSGSMTPNVEEHGMGDGNCWCNKTQNVLGPDDGFVNRQACIDGRTCYTALA